MELDNSLLPPARSIKKDNAWTQDRMSLGRVARPTLRSRGLLGAVKPTLDQDATSNVDHQRNGSVILTKSLPRFNLRQQMIEQFGSQS